MNDHEYLSLTDLGKRFGVTSRVCGQWLADLGLRVVGGSPTDEAFAMGLVRKIPTNRGTGGYYYIWHSRKTMALLDKAGHERLGASYSPDG